MRARLQFVTLLGISAACGGDDQSGITMTTMSSITSVSATMNPSVGTMTTDESGESHETVPTSGGPGTGDESTSMPVEGAPVILSFQTNASKITAGESIMFTAVLTDPDGIDDIVGGTLSDYTGMIGYGPFVAAGRPGTYSIMVSWDAMQQADPINFENADLMRVFRGEFYDQAAHKVSKDLGITLTCAEGSACAGTCTDLMMDMGHCGMCERSCGFACDAGQCAPTYGECIGKNSGFATCEAYCTSIGEACAEAACISNSTIRAFGQTVNCQQMEGGVPANEPCDTIQPWSPGRVAVQCCCTETK